MKRLLALPLLLAVAGCATTTQFARPPADKLECPDEPFAPEGAGPNGRVTDEQNGEYLKALRKSWQGCRADVDWLRDWFKALK